MPRLAVAVLLALVAALAGAAGATAQGTDVERAAQALQRAPVYQDPDAENALSAAELADLRRRVEATNDPIFVAILPRAAGAPNGVVVDLARATRRRGTYAVVVGNSFRAVSNAEPQKTAASEATAAFRAHRGEGVEAVLADFVDRTAQEGVQGNDGGSGGGGGGGGGTECSGPGQCPGGHFCDASNHCIPL